MPESLPQGIGIGFWSRKISFRRYSLASRKVSDPLTHAIIANFAMVWQPWTPTCAYGARCAGRVLPRGATIASMLNATSAPPAEPLNRGCLWTIASVGAGIAMLGTLAIRSAPSAVQDDQARARWSSTAGTLREVSIAYSFQPKASHYDFGARYVYFVRGQMFEGTAVWGVTRSRLLDDVREVAAKYAPTAADVTERDFGFVKDVRRWPVADVSVIVRYNPSNPVDAMFQLPNAGPMNTWATSGTVRVIAWLLIVLGVCFVALAWNLYPRRPRPSFM